MKVKTKLLDFGPELFAPKEDVFEILDFKISNSVQFTRAYIYCVFKYKQGAKSFSITDCKKSLNLDRTVAWHYLTTLSDLGFLKAVRGKNKDFGKSNKLLFCPIDKLIEKEEILVKAKEFLESGGQLK